MPSGVYKHKRRHRMCGTRIYESWVHMKQRCSNKNGKDYKNYGGRGIKVCNRWMKFENFYQDMGEMPSDKTLDRKDNNKGYNKKNCRWATRKQQGENKRNNRFLTYQGKTQTISQWAKELGLSNNKLFGRLRMGWDVKKAFLRDKFYK